MLADTARWRRDGRLPKGLPTRVIWNPASGGVVLNVLKEELPEERESRFWAFALGAALYAGLLLAV